eukprot:jgi/Ulvmu1/7303/UM035_0092.1
MADIAMGEKVSELRKKARESFITFEHKEGSRLVHEKDLSTILRAIGINPTEQQLANITELIKTHIEDDSALVPYDTFQQVVVPWLLHNEKALKRDHYHTIMRALLAFDPDGKGWVDSQLLKTALTTKGDMLAPDEAIKMISECADTKGRVWCEDYAMMLI